MTTEDEKETQQKQTLDKKAERKQQDHLNFYKIKWERSKRCVIYPARLESLVLACQNRHPFCLLKYR